MNHSATSKPTPHGWRRQRWRGLEEWKELATCARLPALLTASLVAFGVSGCSTNQTSERDTADAWGAVDVDAFGSDRSQMDATDLRDAVAPTTDHTDADAATVPPDVAPPLHHDRYRASAGFASTQGAKGWYYRQFDGASYSDMTYDTAANRWQGSDPFCLIGPSWMHADLHQAVRVWKAPYEGAVTIEGTMERPSIDGDGTRVRITKNGIQIWPSSDWQILSPRFVARHVLMAEVNVGDLIGFQIDRNGDETYDTTNWDPVITYNTPPSFALDKAAIVMDPAVFDAMGIETMDVSLSTVPGGPGQDNVWFHSERFGSDHQKFSGPLDRPGTTLRFEKSAADYFLSNPNHADGQWWLTNVFKASDGGLLGFVHVEKSAASDRYRLGLAYSTNSGDSWTYLGHVIGQYSDPEGANISGTPYLIKDGYFYIYFSDMSPSGGIAAVARAPVEEVLAAARQGTTTPWRKYLTGQWSGEGLGGMASALTLPNVSLHGDAAFSTTKSTYVLTGYNHGPGRGVWIAFSRDGLSWSPGEWLQHSDDPNNETLSPYITIVNENGTDNALIGDSFYAYWAFAPRYTELGNSNLRYLVRQRVELVAPSPPSTAH